jgi:hypothetical protein
MGRAGGPPQFAAALILETDGAGRSPRLSERLNLLENDDEEP